MFKTPDARGEEPEDIDLDFTKKGAIPGLEVTEDTSDPEEKLAQAKKGIDIATRGLEYASKIGDQDMIDLMKRKLEEYEGTIAMLEPKEKPAPQKVFEAADLDDALYSFGEKGAADKADRARRSM